MATAPPAAHRITVRGLRGWELWRCACLRSAGFAVDRLQALAAPAAAAAADRLLVARDHAATARGVATAVCKRALRGASEPQRKRYATALRQLQKQRAPSLDDTDLEVGEAIAAVARAHADLDRVHAELALAFVDAARETGAALRAVAREERFREAVAWQNRAAIASGLDWLLRQPADTGNHEARKIERLIASYLQRYCVKNETIGFFGPVGWAELAGDGDPIALRPGRRLLARRDVLLEYWCVDALASRIADDPAVRGALAPRRLPTVRLDGTTLVQGGRPVAQLAPASAAALARCTGERTAAQIAGELLAVPAYGLTSTEDVVALLEELAERDLVVWTLELPPASLDHERALRDRLASLPPELRAPGLANLDELARLREDVAAAAGDATALVARVGAFERRFTELTGERSTRNAGQSYAGRTVLFEDCCRDVELRIGPDLVARLAEPLRLVLQSARWFVAEIGARYADALLALHGDGGASDFLELWQRAAPLFTSRPGDLPAIVDDARRRLHAVWAELLLGGGADQRRVACRAHELATRVDAAFAAPRAAWPSARMHSPDILLAAPDATALANGGGYFVLGELHVGLNTIASPTFVREHPDPAGMLRDWQADCGAQVVAFIEPKASVSRSDYVSLLPDAIDIEAGAACSARPRTSVFAIADLVVERAGDRLRVCSRDGAWQCDLLAFLDHHLVAEVGTRFSVLPPAPHVPRVTIDDLVVQRERWMIPAVDIAFARIDERRERFVAARAWAREHGMPRFVFFKIPEEPKPYFVDFDSLIYVDIFAKLIRKASTVTITEMLPTPDECWLTDADGNHYSSELRIVAIDPGSVGQS